MNNFGPCTQDCPTRKGGCSKNESSLWTFQRVGGAPRNWTHIKTFRDEIIELSEVPALLKKYGLISEEDTL